MEVDMDGDSDSCSKDSNSPEPDSDEEDVSETAIAEIQEKVTGNPYDYEPHVQLITLLRKACDLDRLRKAREQMSKVFPLTPELWLDWLTDEEKLAVTDDEKQSVISLFERAVKDYTSVSVWLEYVQYIIGQMGSEEGLDTVRKTFDRALTAVGIHVPQGALIWEAYREFESAILGSMQTIEDEPDPEQEKKITAQKNRLFSLFRRQLSVPLLYMEKTYKEFQELTEIDSSTERQYQKALRMLEKVKPFEDALFESEPPHLEEYRRYIQFERKEGNPARVQCIFERALLENCLLPDLWLEYTKYLDQEIKIAEVVLPVHEKAIRNCPWSALCWNNHLLALERYEQPHELIKSAFGKALQSGFTQGEEYQMLWLVYLDYLRRRIKWDKDHDTELEELNAAFERATEYMAYYKDADFQCSILKYWAKIKAKFCKDVSNARELWNTIMNHGHHGESEIWMQYANFERLYGDTKHYRKILLKGLHSVSDWPETIGEALITFEREEGSLETLDVANEKYQKLMQRVQGKRQRMAEKEAERQEAEAMHKKKMKASKRESKQHVAKSKVFKSEPVEKDSQMDSEGFKIPFVPFRAHQTQDVKDSQMRTTERLKRLAEDESHSESKRSKSEEEKEEEEKDHGKTIKHDPAKDQLSVFLSNLAYDVGEDKIKEMFLSVGNIQEVRLVKDYKGRSKGYCYIVFSTMEEAAEALKKDRECLDGRPVFVSPCKDKKNSLSSSSQKFKFGTGLEKNKLFVKGIPFTSTQEDLENIFKEFGPLKQVRIVTYRNGHSKGLAYVDYEDETSASAAVVKTDGLKIGEHTLSVAISNPPQRKPKSNYKSGSVTVSTLLGGGSANVGPRGRAKTQLSLVPRAVQRPNMVQKLSKNTPKTKIQNGGPNSSVTPSDNKKLSNDDFRNMLLKK